MTGKAKDVAIKWWESKSNFKSISIIQNHVREAR